MGDPKIDERRSLGWRLIENLKDNEDLKRRLPQIAVDAALAHAEGAQLAAAVETAIQQQDTLDARLTGMWDKMHPRHEAAWTLFGKHRDRALTAIEGAELRKLLELLEPQAKGRPAQLMQMLDFYNKVVLNEEALELLLEVNLTLAKLTAARTEVHDLKTYESSILMVEASKIAATERQTAALDALDAWRLGLYERIEIVTKDAPHIRKAIGMKV